MPARSACGGRGGRSKRTFIEEARRRQILDAALQLFAQRGYNETSLSDIAAAVDVSKGVISYHFQGKGDLGGGGAAAYAAPLRRFRARAPGIERVPRARNCWSCRPRASTSCKSIHRTTWCTWTLSAASASRSSGSAFMAWADAGMRKLICELLRPGAAEQGNPQIPGRAAGRLCCRPPSMD
jgi:hypothetical protein